MRPNANSSVAIRPASGSNATAASEASVMEMPWACRVAAQEITAKNPMTPVSTAPVMTSMRSSPRWCGVSFLSTE